jgi:hypothetical protein
MQEFLPEVLDGLVGLNDFVFEFGVGVEIVDEVFAFFVVYHLMGFHAEI